MKHLFSLAALLLLTIAAVAQPTSIQRLTSKNGTVSFSPANGQGGTVDIEANAGGGGGSGGSGGILNPSYYTGATTGSNNVFAVRTNWPSVLTSNYVCTNLAYNLGPLTNYGHIQGAVKDTNNHVYLAFTTGIFMVSNNAAISNDNIGSAILLASNTTFFSQLLDPSSHCGAIEWFNNRIYVAVENFTNENAYSSQAIAVFDSTLNFLIAQPATNLGLEISGLCVVPTAQQSTNGVIFVTSYHTNNPSGTGIATNGNNGLRMYDANSLAFLGFFPFATNLTAGGIEHMQDIAWSPWFNRFFITANNPYTYTLFECDLQGRFDTVLGSMGGVVNAPFTFFFGMGDCTLEGVKCQSNEIYLSFFGGADGQCIGSVSMKDGYSSTLDMAGNFTGASLTIAPGGTTVATIDQAGNLTTANYANSGLYTRFYLTNQSSGGWDFMSNGLKNVDLFQLTGDGWLANNNISWTTAGALTAASFTGLGSGLTGLPAGQLTGTVSTNNLFQAGSANTLGSFAVLGPGGNMQLTNGLSTPNQTVWIFGASNVYAQTGHLTNFTLTGALTNGTLNSYLLCTNRFTNSASVTFTNGWQAPLPAFVDIVNSGNSATSYGFRIVNTTNNIMSVLVADTPNNVAISDTSGGLNYIGTSSAASWTNWQLVFTYSSGNTVWIGPASTNGLIASNNVDGTTITFNQGTQQLQGQGTNVLQGTNMFAGTVAGLRYIITNNAGVMAIAPTYTGYWMELSASNNTVQTALQPTTNWVQALSNTPAGITIFNPPVLLGQQSNILVNVAGSVQVDYATDGSAGGAAMLYIFSNNVVVYGASMPSYLQNGAPGTARGAMISFSSISKAGDAWGGGSSITATTNRFLRVTLTGP
jgi:hypothetical protein